MWWNSVLMLTNSRKKVHNFVLLERNYVEVSTWKMAAILTATVTTSFASLLARATLLLDTLTKNAEREKRRRICFDCPLLREFQFSHMLLLLLQTWEFGKSLSDHHNLLEVKIDALFWLRTKSFFFPFCLHEKHQEKCREIDWLLSAAFTTHLFSAPEAKRKITNFK